MWSLDAGAVPAWGWAVGGLTAGLLVVGAVGISCRREHRRLRQEIGGVDQDLQAYKQAHALTHLGLNARLFTLEQAEGGGPFSEPAVTWPYGLDGGITPPGAPLTLRSGILAAVV